MPDDPRDQREIERRMLLALLAWLERSYEGGHPYTALLRQFWKERTGDDLT
jgi:hypothetical protein